MESIDVLKIALAVAFALAGSVKVFKAKPMVSQFKEFGLPEFMVVIVGALEVIGAVGLLIPSLARYASIGLVVLMVGAVVNHVKVKHPIKVVAPAAILGAASLVLAIVLFL